MAAYNLQVLKARLVALACVALFSGALQAQHTAGVGHAGTAGVHSGFGRHPAFRRGDGAAGSHRRSAAGSYWLPYYDSLGYESEEEVVPATAPSIVTQRAPEPPIANAQVIDVPAFANPSASKILRPPAVFILATGERLESRSFVLTASMLSVSLDCQPRDIPMKSLDINATIAANHERGIDLRIPDDRNEISLGF